MRFNICVITRDDMFVFEELATSLAYGLRMLGYETMISRNQIIPFATNIMIGTHQAVELPELPKGTIIYNTEQIIEGSWWLTDRYVGLLRKHIVWDYSHASIKKLREDYDVKDIHYAGLGYCPELEKVKRAQEDIDVLFYGSISERRAKVLQSLHDHEINLEVLFGVYGKELDEYIGRSKIILNIHFFEECFFEPIRVGYLLNNHCCVISEESVNKEDEKILAQGIVICPYEDIVSTCIKYLEITGFRTSVRQEGYKLYKSRPQEEILAPLLRNTNHVKGITL